MPDRTPQPGQYRSDDYTIRNLNHFATMLRELRIAAGMTPAELGAQLPGIYGNGYTASTILKREQGRLSMAIESAIDHLNVCGYELIVRKKDLT